MVCVACDAQCNLCFSRRLLQRTPQEAVLKFTLVGSTSMGQWVVERWPTVQRNSAPKMGAARIWARQEALLRVTPRCGSRWGVLQAEGRERGLGQDDEGSGGGTGDRAGRVRAGCSNGDSSTDGGTTKAGCNSGTTTSRGGIVWFLIQELNTSPSFPI